VRKQKIFKELPKPIDLTVHTKCPEKWTLLDNETGEIYQGNVGGHWDRLDPVIKDTHNFTKRTE
jgi:hypothetical protein